jgi:hypothetical protein
VRTIHKFGVFASFTLDLPDDARFLAVQVQHDTPQIAYKDGKIEVDQ